MLVEFSVKIHVLEWQWKIV